MRRVRVLVVDDEKPARRRLMELLEHESRVEIIGVCTTGMEAVRAVEAAEAADCPIELIFLDVQMPEMDGFAVLEAIKSESMPVVVFATAYDKYALRAFDAHAIDYLLKPYADERFASALNRAIRYLRADRTAAVMNRFESLLEDLHRERGSAPLQRRSPPPRPGASTPYLDRIALREKDRVRFLTVDEIAWIRAEGVYVTLYTLARTSHLHRCLLGELEEALDPRHFIRIHRSTIVNIDAVEEVRVDGRRDFTVLLKDGTEQRLSRTYRDSFQRRLGQRL